MNHPRAFAALLCALAVAATAQPVAVNPPPSPDASPLDGLLAFDAREKSATVKAGEPEAHFLFHVTNVSKASVTIDAVTASCGCTVAHLPAQPWTLPPGARGEIPVTMNVVGKTGEVTKLVYITSRAHGTKVLTVKTTLPPPPGAMERTANEAIARADRQAVFHGDCAACHVAPAREKSGRELFATACAICHDSAHRATMVPSLFTLVRAPEAKDAAFWKNWIAHGKPGSLMPAFAQSEGGFLTDAQIAALADYLVATIPARPVTPPVTATITKPQNQNP